MNIPSERIKTISYNQILKERFSKDPQEVIDYLNIMLESPEEPELFFLALSQVAKALDFNDVTAELGLSRESIHTLSEEKLLILKNVLLLLDSIGLQLTVVRKHTM
ncbi:MAG: hypothetical protein WAQ98_01020 [Blastocatellia bacterium]